MSEIQKPPAKTEESLQILETPSGHKAVQALEKITGSKLEQLTELALFQQIKSAIEQLRALNQRVPTLIDDSLLKLEEVLGAAAQREQRTQYAVRRLFGILFIFINAQSAFLLHGAKRVFAADLESTGPPRSAEVLPSPAEEIQPMSIDEAVGELGIEMFTDRYVHPLYEAYWPTHEVYDYLMKNYPRTWGQYIAKSPASFGEYVTSGQIELLDMIESAGTENFLDLYLTFEDGLGAGWSSYVSRKDIITVVFQLEVDREYYVINYPHIFAGEATIEELPGLISRLEGRGTVTTFLDRYRHEDWAKSWTPEEFVSVLWEYDWESPDDFYLLVTTYPSTFTRYLGNLDPALIFKDHEEKLASSYFSDGYYHSWNYEQFVAAIKANRPDDYQLLLEPYTPSEVFYKAGLEELIFGAEFSAGEEDNYFFSHYQEEFADKWSSRAVLNWLAERDGANSWYDLVLGNRQIFGDVVSERELLLMMDGSSAGYRENFAHYYQREGWQEIWSPEQILKIAIAEEKYEFISQNPELFIGMDLPIDVLENILSQDHSFWSNLETWLQFWEAEEILKIARYYDFDRWGGSAGENVVHLSSIELNKRDLQHLLRTSILEVNQRSYPIFLSDYDHFRHLWTPDEILEVLKEVDPNWGMALIQYPWIFHEELNDYQLVDLLNENSTPEDIFENAFFLERYWSIHEISDAIKQVFPDKWGSHIINNSTHFKPIIKPEDLTEILERGGLFPLVDSQSNYDQWSDYWNYQQIYDTVRASGKETIEILFESIYHPTFKPYLLNEPIDSLLIDGAAPYIANNHVYDEEWAEKISPQDLLNHILSTEPEWQDIVASSMNTVGPELHVEIVELFLETADEESVRDFLRYAERDLNLLSISDRQIFETLRRTRGNWSSFVLAHQAAFPNVALSNPELIDEAFKSANQVTIEAYGGDWVDINLTRVELLQLDFNRSTGGNKLDAYMSYLSEAGQEPSGSDNLTSRVLEGNTWLYLVMSNPQLFKEGFKGVTLSRVVEDYQFWSVTLKGFQEIYLEHGWDQIWPAEELLQAALNHPQPEVASKFVLENPAIFEQFIDENPELVDWFLEFHHRELFRRLRYDQWKKIDGEVLLRAMKERFHVESAPISWIEHLMARPESFKYRFDNSNWQLIISDLSTQEDLEAFADVYWYYYWDEQVSVEELSQFSSDAFTAAEIQTALEAAKENWLD